MDEKGIGRAFGPAGLAGCFAVTFPQLPLPVGLAGIALFAAVTVWAYSDVLTDRVSWLRRFKATPMGFDAAARHVAFRSQWAADFDLSKERDWASCQDWRLPLKAEICRPLINGSIRSYGILSTRDFEGENNASPIPQDFWRTAAFSPDMLLMSWGRDKADFASGSIDGADAFYAQIVCDRRAVEQEWPSRSRRQCQKRPSPFVDWSRKQWRTMQAQLNIHQEEWWRENGPKIFGPK